MANDLNNCQFIGRLGKDPELRSMNNGDQVANFSLACGWKGKSSEGTEWVNCVAYGKLAEIIGQYARKGSQIYVAGKMKTRKWQDKSGADRYTTEINVDQMQFLGSKSDDGGQRQQQRAPAKAAMDDDFSDPPF